MDAHAIPGDQHDAITGILDLVLFNNAPASKFHVNQRVARLDGNGDDAAFAHVGEFIERRFLHRALFRGEEKFAGLFPRRIFLVRVGLGQNTNQRGDGLARLQFEQIGDAAALGGAAHVGNFMHALDINAAGVREEHEIIVRAGCEKVLDEIIILIRCALFRRHADDAFAAAALRAIGTDVGALEQAVVRERDDDALVGNEILDVDLAFVGFEISQARGGVFLFDHLQFVLDDGEHAGFLRQNVHQILDALEQFLVFTLDLVNFQAGQLIQTQFQNGVHLPFGQRVTALGQTRLVANQNAPVLDLLLRPLEREQLDPGFLARLAAADDFDEIVEVRQRDKITVEQFGAFLGLLQLEPRPAQHDLAAVLDVAIDEFLQSERLGPAVVNRQHVDGKARFQRGLLVKIVDDDLGDGVTLEFNDHARVFIRFIANGRDVGEARRFFVHQFGHALDEHRAVDVVRNFRDDDLFLAALELFDPDLAANLDAAVARREIFLDDFQSAHHAAGREVRAFDEFHQALDRDVRVVNLRADAVNDFAQIVRRHVRGHADGDARAAVDEQIGKRGGENGRLGAGLVVVGNEIHCVLIHVLHQHRAEMRQPRLGVSHGRRRITFDGTEVALAVHQPFAHGPRLRHVDERRVNRLVTVRMVIAHRFADDFGALDVLAVRHDAEFIHGEKNAALRRFEAVTRVGQRRILFAMNE